MSISEKLTSYEDIAYERLLGQFKDKPVIRALLRTWADMLQEVEDDLYKLMTETLFLNGVGGNLERYGQLFNIPRPSGIADNEYRELIIAEILRRNSDGTPDRIREIIEATSGWYNTRVFEHYNGFQEPHTLGAILVYGYDFGIVSNINVSYETEEARFLKWASPATSGGCVLGLHSLEPSTLYIPSEVTTELLPLGVTSNKTTNPSFEVDLSAWVFTSDKISREETFTDPFHPDGRMLMDTLATAEQPEATTLLVDLQVDQDYTVTAFHTNNQGLTGKIKVGTTPYGNEVGEATVTGSGTVSLTFTPLDINSTYVTLQGNVEASVGYVGYWDNVEVYDTELKADQDFLVDAAGNKISYREVGKGISSILSNELGSGVLAEVGQEVFTTLQALNPNTDNIENLVVESGDAIEVFNGIGITSDNGIFLEISQIENYTEV